MKSDYTTNSRYITHTIAFWKVGRIHFLSSGVKGLIRRLSGRQGHTHEKWRPRHDVITPASSMMSTSWMTSHPIGDWGAWGDTNLGADGIVAAVEWRADLPQAFTDGLRRRAVLEKALHQCRDQRTGNLRRGEARVSKRLVVQPRGGHWGV